MEILYDALRRAVMGAAMMWDEMYNRCVEGGERERGTVGRQAGPRSSSTQAPKPAGKQTDRQTGMHTTRKCRNGRSVGVGNAGNADGQPPKVKYIKKINQKEHQQQQPAGRVYK